MIDAIIFDKDGTLIDFDAFWVSLSVYAIKYLLNKIKREDIETEEFLEVLGVKDGTADINGILCKGTYEEMAVAINGVLKKYNADMAQEEIINTVLEAYNKNANSGKVEPTCQNIKEVLTRLKNSGKKLLVVTTDNYTITNKCLEDLGIKELFDKIYTDDGKTPTKPNPQIIFNFCEESGISKDRIMMVGDTMTDALFARNAGIPFVGVGVKNKDILMDYAIDVVPDISYLFDVLERENSNV